MRKGLQPLLIISISILIAVFLSSCGNSETGSRIVGPGGGTPGGGETSQQWTFTAAGPINSSPAIGNDGTIYVGSEVASLYAINSNGSLKWSFDTMGDVNSSPAIGSDGTVYVGSDNHDISNTRCGKFISCDRK